VISVLMVGSIHYLSRVAGRSLLHFRPALAADEAEFRRDHHAITTTPTPALPAALVVGPVFFYLTRVTDPTFFGMLGAGACYRVPLLLAGYVNTAFIVLGTILSVRYLGLIRRLHAQAPVVNLFERGPLFAFSTLSSRLAFIYAAFSYAFVLAFPSRLRNLPAVAYLLGINLPLMLVLFVYPLYGMHTRMVEEKHRLLEDSARRIQWALAAFQPGVAPRAPQGVDPHRRLTSLIEEESYLRKIPTWPWEPGTLTAVLTGRVPASDAGGRAASCQPVFLGITLGGFVKARLRLTLLAVITTLSALACTLTGPAQEFLVTPPWSNPPPELWSLR
jgi:hypothetical protein